MSFVDLHAHVLPGLDDGARDLGDAMALLAGLHELGFSEVFATPHQRAPELLPTREAIRAAFDVVSAAAAEQAKPHVGLGAENYWDSVFFERVADRSVPTYSPGRSFLLEFSPDRLPPRVEEHLFRLRVKGWLPVVAHPERYAGIARDLSAAETLGRTAALLVDLGALGGAHGRQAAKTARALCEEGLAHGAASDVHREEDLVGVAEGIAWLERRLGSQAVARFLEQAPRAILAGELPERP